MTRDTPMHEPKVANYVEYRHGGRFLHVRGPSREAGELVQIWLSANPGSSIIEELAYLTTGQREFIVKLGEVQ